MVLSSPILIGSTKVKITMFLNASRTGLAATTNHVIPSFNGPAGAIVQALGQACKAGENWLVENAKKPGVKTMPDGLQYKVLVAGKGPQPKPSDSVSAHYKGTLTDGTEFDSSYTRGQPLTIPVLGVIAGWQEALTNMHVGDKWELYIPGALAYGERGSPPKIGAHATLVFEMELLGIEAPKPAGAAPDAPFAPSLRPAPGAGAAPQIKVQPATK